MKKRNRKYITTEVKVVTNEFTVYDRATKKESVVVGTTAPEGVVVLEEKVLETKTAHYRMPIADFIANAEEYTPTKREKK